MPRGGLVSNGCLMVRCFPYNNMQQLFTFATCILFAIFAAAYAFQSWAWRLTGSAPSLPCARRSWCHAPVQTVRRSLSPCAAWVHSEWIKIFKQKEWTSLDDTKLKQTLLTRKRNADLHNQTQLTTKRMKFDDTYTFQIAYRNTNGSFFSAAPRRSSFSSSTRMRRVVGHCRPSSTRSDAPCDTAGATLQRCFGRLPRCFTLCC